MDIDVQVSGSVDEATFPEAPLQLGLDLSRQFCDKHLKRVR